MIDLGDTYNIDQIDLYNTHNRTGNNFGTGDFRIEASNSVVDTGSPYDFDLSGTIETILTGNLSDTSGEDPITTADSFTSITPHTEGAVRYLRFNSLSGIYGDNDLRGLNEIEVFIDTTATDFTWIPSNFGDWADNDNWSFESGLSGVGDRANSSDHTAIFGRWHFRTDHRVNPRRGQRESCCLRQRHQQLCYRRIGQCEPGVRRPILRQSRRR